MGLAGRAGAANSTHYVFVSYCGVVDARWFVAGGGGTVAPATLKQQKRSVKSPARRIQWKGRATSSNSTVEGLLVVRTWRFLVV